MGKAAIGGILILLGIAWLAVVANDAPATMQDRDIGSAEKILKKLLDIPSTGQYRTSAAILDQRGGWRFAHLAYSEDSFGETTRSSYCVVFYNDADGKTFEWKTNIALTECSDPPTHAEVMSLERTNGWPGTAVDGE